MYCIEERKARHIGHIVRAEIYDIEAYHTE